MNGSVCGVVWYGRVWSEWVPAAGDNTENEFGLALIKSNVLCSILLVKIIHLIDSACDHG